MSKPDLYPVQISAEEILAIIKWHEAQARKIPKILGKALLENKGRSFFPAARTARILQEEAEAALKARISRAQELLKVLK